MSDTANSGTTSHSRLAVVESRLGILAERVDDYHERLRAVERVPSDLSHERGRVDELTSKGNATSNAIHALDLRLTAFTSRITTIGLIVALAMPVFTAVLVRLIGK